MSKPSTAPAKTEHVEFDWSTEHGECYECGLPAAFSLTADMADTGKRCCVCAANAAAEGETIIRLFEEW